MKKIFTILLGVFLSIGVFAQTFNGATGLIPDNQTYLDFPVTVSGIGDLNCVQIVLCLNISHTRVGQIYAYLESPSGTLVALSTANGGNGNHYATTCFRMDAASSITSGSAPFNGNYLPEGSFNSFDGEGADGVWNLMIGDATNNTQGTLNSWNITFTSLGVPPSNNNPCTSTEIAVGTSCAMQTFSSVCAGDSGIADPGCGAYNGGDVWFVFEVPAAGFAIIDFDANVVNSAAMAIYTGEDCDNIELTSCYSGATLGTMPPTLTYSGLHLVIVFG